MAWLSAADTIRRLFRWPPVWGAVLLSICGCSSWTETDGQQPYRLLPRPQMAPDSVGLEIATLALPADAAELMQGMGRELDEQIMPVERRRRLAANGLRCGTFGAQLPAGLPELLKAAVEASRRPSFESFKEGVFNQRFVQCRSGRAEEITVTRPADQLFLSYDDGDAVQFEEFADARCLLSFHCLPRGSSGVIIEFTPAIEHGPLRQKYVPDDGEFRIQPSRDHSSYDDLAMTVALRPGETAMLTCTPEATGLGGAFFVNAQSGRQQIVLVRLAQTHLDEMYSEEVGGAVAPADY